jgi:alpha-tubulin suppressor-like RCC1 family protein
VVVSGSLAFATVSVNVRSVCAVTTGNAAYCWGQNNYNELGNGVATNGPTPTPTPVSGGIQFSTVTGNCGLALSGVGYCWGPDQSGELGNGTIGYGSATPVPVY